MSTSKDLADLAEIVHRAIEIQGPAITYGMRHILLGCYHPAPGVMACEGIARSILNKYKIERLT